MYQRTGYERRAAANKGEAAVWNTSPGKKFDKCVTVQAGELNGWEHDVVPAVCVILERELQGVDLRAKHKLNDDDLRHRLITDGCQVLRDRYPDESVVRWVTPLDEFTGAKDGRNKLRLVRADKVLELMDIYRDLM